MKYFELKTNNINDIKTIEAIKESGETVFIYGGGGIVKKEVFETGIKIIHTHPGYLPFVRGSHGLYWSILKRQKFGCSTFYMNQGIDTGGVIIRKEYSMSLFPEIDCDEDTKEDLINFYIDPLIRAITLEEVIKKYENFESLPESVQSKNEGENFYSMHKRLRAQVLKKYLSRK